MILINSFSHTSNCYHTLLIFMISCKFLIEDFNNILIMNITKLATKFIKPALVNGWASLRCININNMVTLKSSANKHICINNKNTKNLTTNIVFRNSNNK